MEMKEWSSHSWNASAPIKTVIQFLHLHSRAVLTAA
jgi:hypothetical protein